MTEHLSSYPHSLPPIPRQSWRDQSACHPMEIRRRGDTLDIFDGPGSARGTDRDAWEVQARYVAAKYCRTCPVLDACRKDPWTRRRNDVIQAGRYRVRVKGKWETTDLLKAAA